MSLAVLMGALFATTGAPFARLLTRAAARQKNLTRSEILCDHPNVAEFSRVTQPLLRQRSDVAGSCSSTYSTR